MKYKLENVIIGYVEEDGSEQESTFSNATDALIFIEENKNEIDFEEAKITGNFIENRIIHSASEDDLDYGEQELSINDLERISEEEPMRFRRSPKKPVSDLLKEIEENQKTDDNIKNNKRKVRRKISRN